MDPIKIAQAVEKFKIPVICATCNKYWQARDRGLPEPQCLAVDNCTSPIGGGNFHEYEGPIPDFRIWCFVCGSSCSKYIFVKGKQRIFGICDLHLEDAKTLVPVGIENPEVLERYYVENNQVKPLNIGTQPFRKIGLIETINEVEGYYAKKNNQEWTDLK